MRKTLASVNIPAVCRDHILLDCAIRDNSRIYLLAREDVTEDEVSSVEDGDISTRLIFLRETDEDENLRVAARDYENFTWPLLGVSHKPVEQALLVASDADGTVAPVGSGTWPAEVLKTKGYPQCKHLRCIDGYTWAVGINRGVYKRIDIGNWVKITEGLSFDEPDDVDVGFNDIDGFSGKEVYAVGGRGDIWKYDGAIWARCDFPADDDLYTVCCAGDGAIYVGARNALWKCKGNQWTKICELPRKRMRDLRWFGDRLWLAYDYRLLMWDGQVLHDEIVHNGNRLSLGGAIDVSDEMLLVACSYAAWTYDGKSWHSIIPEFNRGNLGE